MMKIAMFALTILLFSSLCWGQTKGKALIHQGPKTTDAVRHDEIRWASREGVISMIPLVITTQTSLKENRNSIKITLTPTRINFGITF